MTLTPQHFISEAIVPVFDQPPALEKKPGCPDGFLWREKTYRITDLLVEWVDKN